MDIGYEIRLRFVTDSGNFLEHESIVLDKDSMLEEIEEVAFQSTGYPLEYWLKREMDFEEDNFFYVFYPNEEDKSSRYQLTVAEV